MLAVYIDAARCKGCQLCLRFCPHNVLDLSPYPNALGYYPARVDKQEACTGCQACFLMCPDCAITIVREAK